MTSAKRNELDPKPIKCQGLDLTSMKTQSSNMDRRWNPAMDSALGWS